MDNIKKFKDFLDRMQGLLDNAKKQGHIIVRVEDLENTFPELKESEDERIRKRIIQALHGDVLEMSETKECLAWLEKQKDIVTGNYKQAEEEKRKQAGYGFMLCKADILDFKEGEHYWLEYIGDDNYNVRSDNLLGKTYHLTPMQFYLCFRPLTWLEKQGEQKPTPPKWKYKKDHIPLLRDSLILNKYGCVAKSPSGAIVSDVWVIDYDELAKLPKEELENQGVNSASVSDGNTSVTSKEVVSHPTAFSTIEPKFKVGDWLQYRNAKPFLVKEITKQGYVNGDSCLPFNWENEIHLWTIDDAKDGDVLACNEEILLFKSYSVQGRISLYCWYNGQTNNFHSREVNDTLLTTRNKICPATKEQRNLLFTKMHEAGYEWDAKKKELKKIDSFCQKNCKGFQETGKCYCDGECDAKRKSEQKQVWSEEDERIRQCLIRDQEKALDDVRNDKYGHSEIISDLKEMYRERLNWLKSVKQRIEGE